MPAQLRPSLFAAAAFALRPPARRAVAQRAKAGGSCRTDLSELNQNVNPRCGGKLGAIETTGYKLPAAPFPRSRPGLVIDYFAGGGGASTGIEQAIGRHIDVAVNHDPLAIAMHKVNHPKTLHLCESVLALDPRDVVAAAGGGPVALWWFSPDCKHFSKAKGGRPVEKKIRGLAWVVVQAAKLCRPLMICLENVEEFQDWGPVNQDGYPDKIHKGKTFKLWVKRLQQCGYDVEWKEQRCAAFGAPTIRKRLVVIARCDGLPIVWPRETHGTAAACRLNPRLVEERSAASIIDWSIECPSIFERKRPLVDATCRRIAQGLFKYVIDSAEPFIVPITNKKWGGDRAQPVHEPLRTITTAKGGEYAVANPSFVHIDKVSGFIAQHNSGVIGRALDAPLSTIMMRATQQALVTSHIVKFRGKEFGHSAETPLHTITAGGLHFGEVRAFLIKYYGQGAGQDLLEPLHTVTTKDRFGLITVQIQGETYAIADIGMRMLTSRELYNAQGFPPDYVIDRYADGSPIIRTQQTAKCGNSVPPPLAKAHVEANWATIEPLALAA